MFEVVFHFSPEKMQTSHKKTGFPYGSCIVGCAIVVNAEGYGLCVPGRFFVTGCGHEFGYRMLKLLAQAQ